MNEEAARVQHPAANSTAVPSLSGFPISGLINSAARIGDMADPIGVQNIEAVIERTERIAALIVETASALPSLTPANFGFVLDGKAERA